MARAGVASARDVALEIERRLPGVGEVKLHKLLYYVQGYHLAWEQEPAGARHRQPSDLPPITRRLLQHRAQLGARDERTRRDNPRRQ